MQIKKPTHEKLRFNYTTADKRLEKSRPECYNNEDTFTFNKRGYFYVEKV